MLQSFLAGAGAGAESGRTDHGLGTGATESAIFALLSEVLTNAIRAWPDIHANDARFARYLGERVKADESVEVFLRTIHGSDLYLAFACAEGDRRALAQFDRDLTRDLPQYVAKVKNSGHFFAEVKEI
jgi:RNA polymerase sigma-70 factor (ECF subfamily)